MADLKDTIRLITQADLSALSDLIAEYKRLGLSISGVAGASRIVSEQIKRDALEQSNATKQATLELRRQSAAIDLAKKSSDGLGLSLSSLTGLRSQLIGLFGAMSVGSFAKDIIDAQSTVQAFGLSMKNLLGNSYGEKLLSDLKIFTVNTPLNFEEVIKSTNQLVGSFKAAGASSKTIGTEIPQILESIGNSAASLGGADRMGRLIYAFSQVQATGRLMGTEVRQITETGFPMLAVLTQSLSERFPKLALSVSDVQKRISDGKVSFEDFKIAILSAGQAGGVFAGGMEARMATVAGSLDKLKESAFFALANIGNQFNDTAKKAIDFGSSIIKTFFGTNEAAQRSVEIVSNLTKIYLGYRAALALVATTTLLKDAYDKASLITQGLLMRSKALLNGESQKFITLMAEETLAKTVNTGATTGTTTAIEVMTIAEAKAAIATRSLTAAFGVIAIVLGVAYAAYEIYKSTVAEADEKQKEFNDRIALGVAPIKESQSEFNRLTTALKNSSDATQEKTTKLEALKAKFPEQLKGVNDLATAEKLLGDKANDTNIVKEYRLKLFDQLKGKFPEQTKGLKDVNFSESELSKVMKEVNGDFLIRQQLMKDEIKLNINKEQINILLKEQIKLEGDLANASKNRLLTLSGSKTGTKITGVEKSEYDIAQENIKSRESSVLKLQEINAKIVENSIETTKKLKFNWDEQNKDANGAGKKQGEDADKNGKAKMEKALKYQAETMMQGKVMDEIAFRRELESTKDSEIAIRTMEKLYADIRLKDAIGSQKQKQDEQTKLDNDFANDIANLKRKWNAKEKVEKIKAEKEKNKEIEDETWKRINLEWKLIEDRNNDELEAWRTLQKDLKKLDEKANDEEIKLNEDTFKLIEKLRILQKISTAKNSKEIVEIENQEKESILVLRKDRHNKEILLIDEKLKKLKESGKTETVEYKELQVSKLIEVQSFTNAEIDLIEFITEKKKDAIDKQMQDYKDAMGFVERSSEAFFGAVNGWIDKSLSETNDIVEKAQLENEKAGLNIAKQGISAISAFVNGDFVDGFFKTIGTLYNALNITNDNASRLAKANLEKATELLKDYLSVVEKDVDALMNKFDTIKEVYGDIKTGQSGFVKDLTFNVLLEESLSLLLIFKDAKTTIDDIVETSKVGIGDLIQGEISRGQQIQKNYDTAVSNENNIFSKKKDSIEKTYDNEIKRIRDAYDIAIGLINNKYDYESIRVNQQYDAQTLAITAAGTAELEALITNETSLSSVREEFAGKRLNILNAFPLANKAITEGMSEAEVAAINSSITARDAALAKLQGWYNSELTTIINSEGQKRKEYTATELIQNKIQERLDLAAIKFQADEIVRQQKKQQDIINLNTKRDADELIALGVKSSAIELATKELNGKLLLLEQQKNKDIADSFTILTALLVNQSEQISNALENSASKGTEAYKQLEAQLQVVNRLLEQIRNGNQNTPFVIPTNIPFDFDFTNIPRIPFYRGTDNTSVSMSGKPTVDSKGGWAATIHPDEAIFSKADMTQMTRFMGSRPSRAEVIERFKMGSKMIDSNSFIQKVSPYVISKTENNQIMDIQGLRSDLSKLTKEVVKRQQPLVQIDKNGIRTYMTNINSQIEMKNQKFAN